MFALLVALLARVSRRCCVHARTLPDAVSTIDAMLWKVRAPFRPSRGAGRRRTPLVVRSSSSPSPACWQKNQFARVSANQFARARSASPRRSNQTRWAPSLGGRRRDYDERE